MKSPSPSNLLRRAITAAFAAPLICLSSLQAQSNTKEPPVTSNTEELVELPSFTVTTERDNSYTGKQALSTTRTGTDLSDLAQTVAVLNQAFLKGTLNNV